MVVEMACKKGIMIAHYYNLQDQVCVSSHLLFRAAL